MRLLHIISGLGTGGAEHMLLKLLGAPGLAGFEHRVVSLRSRGALAESMRALGVEVVELDMPRGVPGLRGVLTLRNTVRRYDPDVIQGWMYHGNLAALFARVSARQRVPLLWNVRQSLNDLATTPLATRLAIRLGSALSRFPDRILYNSNVSMVQHQRCGYVAGHSLFVPNGFLTDRFAPDPATRASMRRQWNVGAEEVLFGVVARYHPMKDYPGLLMAAANTVASRPSVRFVLVGNGVDTANRTLLGAIAELGLRDRVVLLGERRDIPAIMAALDVYVSSSSRDEGFSNSIGEAMSSGVPCIVTDVGDSAAVVADTGRVVAASDPSRLADAMVAMIDAGDEYRGRLGQRARDRVIQHYSIDAVAETYARLYRELARGCPPVAGDKVNVMRSDGN